MKKIVIALAGIILAGFVFGFTIGKLTSPDYRVEANVLKYIYSHIQPVAHDGAMAYKMTCGSKVWQYDPKTDSVKVSYGSPLAVQNISVRKNYKSINLNMMYSIVGGGPTAIIGGIKFIDYLAPLSKNQRVLFAVAAVLTTASGAYWGYRLGYSNDIECSSEIVQKVLNDNKMWQTYVAYRQTSPIIGVAPTGSQKN
jgi:hypothetical protein